MEYSGLKKMDNLKMRITDSQKLSNMFPFTRTILMPKWKTKFLYFSFIYIA